MKDKRIIYHKDEPDWDKFFHDTKDCIQGIIDKESGIANLNYDKFL